MADLATMLLDMGLYKDAVSLLTKAPHQLDKPPRKRHTLTWAFLHLGDVGAAERQWAICQPPEDDDVPHSYTTVDGILQRIAAYNQVANLHKRDLRGWNFAFNGSFLLHCSPYGVEQLNGRYAVLYDSERLCLEGITRLKAVLDACKLAVPRVYALPEHDSQVYMP